MHRLRGIAMRDIARTHNYSRGPITARAAMQDSERISHHAGIHNLLRSDLLLEMRPGIERAIFFGFDRNFGQLLNCHAIFMHVALRAHGIKPRHGKTIGKIPIFSSMNQSLASKIELIHTKGQSNVTFSGSDGQRGMTQSNSARRTRTFHIADRHARQAQTLEHALSGH